jgi:hypothetical protein
MTTTVHTAMKENSRRALRGLAVGVGIVAYFGGLLYAGVRSYDLFARTLPAELLPLAVIGILALELTAVGLPLAIHYWTAPGAQRMAAQAFYVADLLLIAANAILDSAHNAGDILPGFMAAYGVYAVPALPIFVMVTWAALWALDPASREADMRAAVQAATFDAMLAQIVEEAKAVDIADDVRAAAAERARAIVGETLGRGKAGRPALPAAPLVGGHSYNAQAPARPVVGPRPADDDAAEYGRATEAVPVQAPRPARNGTRKGAAADGPKA